VKRRISSLLALAFLAGSLLFGLAVHVSNPVLPDDDAYITYRYADNLLNGQGLVYNPGQRVFGSSTPLYVVWLAGLRAVARSVPTPELAVRANFVFYALAGVGIFLLLTALGSSPSLSGLLAGLLALNPGLLQASMGGMETFLFTGLIVWSLWALVRRKFGLSAWLAGLSVLARPEGTLMVVVVFAIWLVPHRDWRELIGLFVPGLVWVAFATPYFGTPVYHSILAKSRPLYPLPAGDAFGRLVSEIAAWTTGGLKSWLADTPIFSLPLLALVLVAAACGYVARMRLKASASGESDDELEPTLRTSDNLGVRLLDRDRQARQACLHALAVPALLALFVAFYTVTNPKLFAWYLPPVECLWFTTLASGVVFGSAWLKDRRGTRLAGIPVLGLVVLFGVPALSPLLFRITTRRPATDLRLASSPDLARTTVYRAVAEWLNLVAPPGDTLIAPEVGALGYHYRGHVIDACGLVSPEALPFLPVPASERTRPDVGAISLELVKHLQCDIVVTMQMFASRSLYPSDWFGQRYELVRQFKLPLRCWGPSGDTIDVFFKRGGRALQSWRAVGATLGPRNQPY
jgi:arabinofuranosyltransferase